MTTVIRWNPVREMASMQNTLDRLFDETWRGVGGGTTNAALALDIHETDSAYIISAAVPGVSADNINISLHDGVVTISGEVPQVTHENSRALLLERVYGKFERNLRLPQPLDPSGVEAVVDNGVLTLTLSKSPEAQPRTIPVKVNSANS